MNELLIKMLDRGGSDLHLTVGQLPKVRVNGVISTLEGAVIDSENMERLLETICPDRRWLHFLEEHDLDFAYEIPGRARFRANYLYNHWGQAAVFRLIPSKIKTLDELGLPQAMKTICGYTRGLVMVTGPIGSGATTTLAAMIDHINETACKYVIAIEEPIEFVHTNKKSIIVHREVGQHSESFADALNGAMRADPNVIFLGEMSDPETIRLALTCASMGILVFGTMHTSSAIKTIDRIIDTFPAEECPQIRTMLADCLAGVVSQVLCRTVGGGYVAVHEILLTHDALPHAIRSGKLNTIRGILERNANRGMCTMTAKLKELIASGKITPNEAYMKAVDKKVFHHLLNQGQPLKRLKR